MKKSIWMAIFAIVAVALWLLSGQFVARPSVEHANNNSGAVPMMSVEALASVAETVKSEVIVQGVLEAQRKVSLRAETAGMVRKLHVDIGDKVESGQVLLELQEKDRYAQIAKAEAEIVSKQLVVEGMRRLHDRGLQSETNLKQAQADLAAARAEKKRLQLDLADTAIRAPFAGMVETRAVELGSYVDVGDSVAEIIDVSRLKAVAYVTQQNISRLALGQTVLIRLLDGREATAELTFIAKEADVTTRSFRVEAEFANDTLVAGVSAELHIAVGKTQAHFISPAVLTLDESGRLGVKTLNSDNRVVFKPVTVVRTESHGVWVEGLNARENIIARGQGFVLPGEKVNPVYPQAD